MIEDHTLSVLCCRFAHFLSEILCTFCQAPVQKLRTRRNYPEFYVTQTMNIVDSIEYLYCVPNRDHIMCTQSGIQIVYPIKYIYCVPNWGYIKCVPDQVYKLCTWLGVAYLDQLSAEPMPYKAGLGARFVDPIGYSMYIPDWVQISLYLPYFEGLLEFCGQGQELDNMMLLPINQSIIINCDF